ncbi:hypothetical protein GY632_6534 [Trichophyton interdigitale]|nr:hypothetical protein GY632_6534 [Trichophyton interdigitale]
MSSSDPGILLVDRREAAVPLQRAAIWPERAAALGSSSGAAKAIEAGLSFPLLCVPASRTGGRRRTEPNRAGRAIEAEAEAEAEAAGRCSSSSSSRRQATADDPM